MAGIRDKIIHGYFAIIYDIVWDVIIHKIPELEPKIRAIYDEMGVRSRKVMYFRQFRIVVPLCVYPLLSNTHSHFCLKTEISIRKRH